MDLLKKILSSKLLRGLFSAVFIYFAFRRINIFHLANELTMVPKWFVVTMIVYFSFTMFLGGIRWSVLVIDKPKLIDFWNFTKATYIGGFYSLFFPTMVAGDVLKWLPLLKKYPNLSKITLAGSVIVDRMVGFSAFTIMAFVAIILGKLLKYQFPDVLFWLFAGLTFGVVVFYGLVFSIDFEKLLSRFERKYKWLHKVLEVIDLLKTENKKKILTCFLISLVSEPIWILPVWFYSLIFHTGISLLQVYIFIPIISLILVLPISVAGFGARENLYLAFFGTLGLADEKILLMSTFGGILGVLSSLIGGLLLLIP